MSASISNEYNPDRPLWWILSVNAIAAVGGGGAGYLFLGSGGSGQLGAAQGAWAGALAGSAVVWSGVALIGIVLVIRDAFRLEAPEAEPEAVAALAPPRVEGLIRGPVEDPIVPPPGPHAVAWNDESEHEHRESARDGQRSAASLGRQRRPSVQVRSREEELVNSN